MVSKNINITLFLALVLVLPFSGLFSTEIQAEDYPELQPSPDSKGKSAIKSALRILKRIDGSKNPDKHYKKILKYEANVRKRDPDYDYDKLKAVAQEAVKNAKLNREKEKEEKVAKKARKAEERAQREAEADRAHEEESAKRKFANRLDDLMYKDSVNLSMSEDNPNDLKSVLSEMKNIRSDADNFVAENSKLLDEVRQLKKQGDGDYDEYHHERWWRYQSMVEQHIDKHNKFFPQLTSDPAHQVTTNFEYAELEIIAMNLYVGATITGDAALSEMSENADRTLAALPDPVKLREQMEANTMAEAVFPEALYQDAALEEKFREAFEGTGWGEKVVKISLKEKKWTPAFNNLGLFMGDTMAAWIGAIDSEGRGKMYDFRILYRGEKYPSIRRNHEMTGWILPENIK